MSYEEEKDSDQAAEKKRSQVQFWLKQIDESLLREEDWRKAGKDCVTMYEARKDISFNMLYANTETLSPALYSSTPKPAVMRRYKNEEDLVAKIGAEILNRALTYQMDTNGDAVNDFDELMEDIVLSGLVPGRGVVWYRYDAKFEQAAPALNVLEERDGGKAITPTPPVRKVVDEDILRELVPWDQYTQGFARQWRDVPWVARCHNLTKDELMAQFPECGAKVVCTSAEPEDTHQHKGSHAESGAPQTAAVWEIWDKTTKTVWFVSSGYAEGPMKQESDPLKLSGFFPCPRPLSFTRQLSGLVPQTLYEYYRAQAEELEAVTKRLKGLIQAMRIRGMYNALIDDIAQLLDSEENTLMPITSAGALEGDLQRAIWLVPIQDYVPVIQELWTQREQLKKVIYEMTGISDIIRGSTVASETATAQGIKSKWGTLRLQTMQGRVKRLAREMLRMESEIMCGHFGKAKFKAMTDTHLLTNEEREQLQQGLQAEAQSAMLAGEQPQPPNPQVLRALKSPTWEDVLKFLKNDMLRMFRLDIETDSTLADSIRADQEEMTAMLTAVTQLIQGLTPAVQGGFLGFETAKGILVGVARRFRLGSDLETALDSAQAPPPPAEEAGKAEAQQAAVAQQKQQMEMQAKQAEDARVQAQEDRQAEMAEKQLDMQMKQQQMALDSQRMQQDMEYAAAEHQMKMRELQLKSELAEKQVLGKLAVIEAQTQAAKVKAATPAPESKGE
jgi:hypothetical protein